jgi:hypothetical protein
MSRLPIDAGVGAYGVMTVGVIKAGAVAHRGATSPVYDQDGKKTRALVNHPACVPAEDGEPVGVRSPRFPEVSAAWADHLGAVACTEPKCFPGAAS